MIQIGSKNKQKETMEISKILFKFMLNREKKTGEKINSWGQIGVKVD